MRKIGKINKKKINPKMKENAIEMKPLDDKNKTSYKIYRGSKNIFDKYLRVWINFNPI